MRTLKPSLSRWIREGSGWRSIEVQHGRPVWSVQRLGRCRWLAQVSWCSPGMVCRSAEDARAACERYEHDYWKPDGRYWERDRATSRHTYREMTST